jgi:SAM-dependent methyltransferase
MTATEKESGHPFYRCVRCGGTLTSQEEGGVLACGTCAAAYPSVGGVKILTLHPDQLLQSYLRKVAAKRQDIESSKEEVANVDDARHSRTAIALALAGYEGELANLGLIERVLRPAEEYLAAQPRKTSLFGDFQLGDRGWPSFEMLGYFYRDWTPTDEAGFITRLVADAVRRHCGDRRESVAVLGCGAGRLVYDLAELFPAAFGLDLAVDSLLLAQALLDGAKIDLHFNFPRSRTPLAQKTVQVQGSADKRPGIDLVAGNVNRLPFAASSLSCVVTPYLLDVVPSPTAVIAEIRRVLAPQGIWINFSNPSGASMLRSLDQLNDLDLATFLRGSGFTLLDSALHRFTLLDLSSLSDWAPASVETPILSAARKDEAPEPERHDPFEEYFAGTGTSIWHLAPRIAAYVALVQERAFTEGGVEERKRIAVFSPGSSRPLTEESAAVAGFLLRNVDGRRTMQEVFDALRQAYGESVRADEFVSLLRDLHEEHLIAVEPLS